MSSNATTVHQDVSDLHWVQVSFTGATFARHFGAQTAGGTIFAALDEGAGRAGMDLTFAPGVSPQNLDWSELQWSGATFARHFRACVGKGSLIASVMEGVEKAGLGLTYIPIAPPPPLTWAQVSFTGATFASHFVAQIPGGKLYAALDEGAKKAGLGLVFAPGASSPTLNWSELTWSGANLGRHFTARIGAGSLIASVMEGVGKAGLGLAYIPIASLPPLTWTQVSFTGATFASHFVAQIPGGRLHAALAEGAGKAGLGLVFIPA